MQTKRRKAISTLLALATVFSLLAVVPLYASAAPTITQHPANVRVIEGEPMSFSVKASGTGTLTYRWEFYNISTKKWENIPAISGITGTTSDTLNIVMSLSVVSGWQVRCIVTDSTGETTSNVATISVRDDGNGIALFSIKTQPRDISTEAGGTVSFAVLVDGGAAPYTYKWQCDAGNGVKDLSDDSVYSGVNTMALTLTNVPVSYNGYKYRCIIKDRPGTNTLQSDFVTLTITTIAPKIEGPATMTIPVGYTATSTSIFTLTGSTPIIVSKLFGDEKITWNDSAKVLSISAGLKEGTYPVILKVTNGISPDADFTFTLTVGAAVTSEAPTITAPAALSLTAGYAATSTSIFTITGTPTSIVTKVSGDEKITWNDTTRKLDIAAGLAAGSYPVVLKATNGTAPDAECTYTITVTTGAATPTGMAYFKATRTYTTSLFTDINEDEWYGINKNKSIATAYEYGLVNGMGDGKFGPNSDFTIIQAIALAARVHSIYSTGNDIVQAGEPWYKAFLDYAVANGIVTANEFNDLNRPCTRAEMAYFFSKSLPAAEFTKQNTVNSLPDVNGSTPYYSSIIMLFESGVVSGNNTQGEFTPGNTMTRAMAAGIINNIIIPANRASGKTYG